MSWLVLLGGIQFLGLGITLARLAYDEWQQARLSNPVHAASEDRHSRVEYETMEHRNNVISIGQGAANLGRTFWTFSYPHQVVTDPKMGIDEKRAILAAWASDEHAVESFPTLRHLPGTPFPVTFSSIMDAMTRLDRMGSDREDDDPPPTAPAALRVTTLNAAA